MGEGENNDLKIMFLIVLHLEKLNGYFKIVSILYVLSSLLPTQGCKHLGGGVNF